MTPPPKTTPRRAAASEDWAAVLRLIRDSFAAMADRIDPPSSMLELTEAGIAAQNTTGEVWLIGTPPVACVFLTVKPPALYLGKLAVVASQRRNGLARALITLAGVRARALGLTALELQTRVELTENHATFAALGFLETRKTAHIGYDRPTSLTLQRPVPPI